MDMIRDYLAMGGYAAFIWPAFALSFIVLVGLMVTSLKNLKASERALDEAGANRAMREEAEP
jgi:heme exporter protein D